MFKKEKSQGYIYEIAEQNGGMIGIPQWLFDKQEYKLLSMDSKLVYAMLLYRHNPEAMKSGDTTVGETLEIVLSMDVLIDMVKRMLPCSKVTAKKVISQLIDKGLVSVNTMPKI